METKKEELMINPEDATCDGHPEAITNKQTTFELNNQKRLAEDNAPKKRPQAAQEL